MIRSPSFDRVDTGRPTKGPADERPVCGADGVHTGERSGAMPEEEVRNLRVE
jgi:hypothetical protein